MEKEVRNYEIELRADNDKGIVEGYALLFNTLSRDLGGFVEEIAPSALNGVLDRSDVLAVLNHNENKGVFARSRFGKGSLHLEVDDKGLRYWWKVGKSSTHQELAELIERGDIFSSSFAFTVKEDGETWENIGNGMYKRTITQFDELFDVSPVYRPAYEATTVGKRSADKIEELKKAELEKAEAERQVKENVEQVAEKKKQELNDYYKSFENIIQTFKN